jgi:hypothetical protein
MPLVVSSATVPKRKMFVKKAAKVKRVVILKLA